MSVQAGTAFVDIETGKVDLKRLRSALDTEQTTAKSSWGSTFKSIAVGAGAAFAAVKIGSFLGGAISEFQESAKVGRLSEAVIKSTGQAANITAGQMGELASALSAKTGIDDEVIQSGENVLATFTSVRNEVGKGNDIFNQATATAADMSAALGTDMQGSVIQLGKALNDPIQGITALSRVGVSFTEQQKDQIKTLVESGDVLGAQKVVLAELSKEFGGAAEAAADPFARLQVIIGNFKETLGGALAPALTQIAPLLGQALEAVGPVLGQALGAIAPAIQPLVTALGPLLSGLVTGITPIIGALGPVIATIGTVLGQLAPVIGTIGTALAPVVGAFGNLATVIAYLLPPIAELVGGVLTELAPVLKPIIEAVTVVAHAFGRALVTALKVLVPIIGKVAAILGGAIGKVLNALAPVLAQVAELVGKFLAQAFKLLEPVLTTVATVIADVAGTLLTALMPVLPPLIQVVLQLVQAVLPLITALLPLITTILPPLAELLALLLPPIVEVATVLIGLLVPVIQEVVSWFTDLEATAETVWNAIRTVVVTAINIVKGIIQTQLNAIKAIWDGIWGSFTGIVSGIWDGVTGALRTGINFVIGLVNKFIGFWNDLEFTAPEIDLGPLGSVGGFTIGLPDIPKIPKLHDGTGPGGFQPLSGSEGLALLQRGETVRTPEQEAALNRPAVQIDRIYAWDAREAAEAIRREQTWAALTA